MANCTVTLPSANADYCNPNVHFGEISIFLWTRAADGDELDDVTDDAEWTTRLSNSTSLPALGTAAPIRYLFGRGELPLPEQAEQEISLGRVVTNDPRHTMTFNSDDTGTTNAGLLAALQAQNYTYRYWFVADGQLFGGNTGFIGPVRFNGRVIPGSKDEVQTINITARWTGVITAPVDSVIEDVLAIE